VWNQILKSANRIERLARASFFAGGRNRTIEPNLVTFSRRVADCKSFQMPQPLLRYSLPDKCFLRASEKHLTIATAVMAGGTLTPLSVNEAHVNPL
jgi:hypothetical protein